MSSVLAPEPGYACRVLQNRHVQAEVEPVGTLELEGDVVVQDLRNVAWWRAPVVRGIKANCPPQADLLMKWGYGSAKGSTGALPVRAGRISRPIWIRNQAAGKGWAAVARYCWTLWKSLAAHPLPAANRARQPLFR